MTKIFWIGVYSNNAHPSYRGQFMGIDMNSGGYPFATESPGAIHFFTSKTEAENYISHFSDIEMKKLTMIIGE